MNKVRTIGWLRGSLIRAVLAGLIGVGSGLAADAQQSADLQRQQLNRIISVLRLQPQAAGQSCLDALREVHTTEGQVKDLQTRAKDPDKVLAQDVLETDYENGAEICGADASRVCAQPAAVAGLSAACATLHREAPGR